MKYVEILSALLTPVIAIVTTYIAIQQYRNERAKTRRELYEKRLEVYQASSKFLNFSWSDNLLSHDVLRELNSAVYESPFLFENDICNFVESIQQKARKKLMLLSRVAQTPLEDSFDLKQEIRDIDRWFDSQRPVIQDKFMPYLNLKTLK